MRVDGMRRLADCLTALYGVRHWRLGSAIVTVAAVTVATGGPITVQILS